MTTHKPIISIVMATHNRRAVVEHTLSQIDQCGLDRADYETIVVDNDSTDGTPAAIVHRVNRLICLPRNAGSTAKAFGTDEAKGTYILFLDDDSYPRPGCLERMIRRFEDYGHLGAAGFAVHLPTGRKECAALPGIFVGCGVGLRTEAYKEVGGLDRTFFMQAEEYDLSFRLAAAGWDVDVFDDLQVEHEKTPQERCGDRTVHYDTRNNLRVVARYLPSPFAAIYRVDCVQRYEWLAAREGEEHLRAFHRGRLAGDLHGVVERRLYHRNRLSEPAFERFFRWSEIRNRMTELWQGGANRLLFADLGKNIYPFHLAARQLGLDVVAIADDRFAAPGRDYRGTPILPVAEALNCAYDAVVVSNTGAVHAADTAALLTLKTKAPIHCWFGECQSQSESSFIQPKSPHMADHKKELAGIGPGRAN
jgi:GT2 family glycosyltransferase